MSAPSFRTYGRHATKVYDRGKLLEGELYVVFRGAKQVVRAGETIHVPANALHQFHNSSTQPVRMLCICSPAGQEEFFMQVGVLDASRTPPPPELDAAAQKVTNRGVICFYSTQTK